MASALRAHAGSASTQQAACAALAALCTGPWGASATAVGCPEAVCAAFLLHKPSRGVQEAAVEALLALCLCDAAAVRAARDSMARGLIEGFAREHGAVAGSPAAELLRLLRLADEAAAGGAEGGDFAADYDSYERDAPR